MNRKSVGALLARSGGCLARGVPEEGGRPRPPPSAASHDRRREDALRPRRVMGAASSCAGRCSSLRARARASSCSGLRATARGGKPEFAIEPYLPKFERARARPRRVGRRREARRRPRLPRHRGAGARRAQLPVGPVYKTLKPGAGASPKATDVVQRALPRHAPRRERVRQLRPSAASPAEFAAQPGDPVLDRGRRAHEGGREGEARLPLRDRLRRRGHRRAARSRPEPRWCSRWSCSGINPRARRARPATEGESP